MNSPRYLGPACHKGHAGWRYVSTGNCVACQCEKAAEQRERRRQFRRPKAARIAAQPALDAAIAAGALRFEGWPCAVCGGTLRYVVPNHACVACRRRHSQTHAAKIKGTRSRAHDHRAVYLGRLCPDCGGYKRRVSDHRCVACVASQAAEQRYKHEDWGALVPVPHRPLPDIAVIAAPGITKQMLMARR